MNNHIWEWCTQYQCDTAGPESYGGGGGVTGMGLRGYKKETTVNLEIVLIHYVSVAIQCEKHCVTRNTLDWKCPHVSAYRCTML